eukprot:scaffold54280_cov60-Phaeocystis_antarctica.AAC.1
MASPMQARTHGVPTNRLNTTQTRLARIHSRGVFGSASSPPRRLVLSEPLPPVPEPLPAPADDTDGVTSFSSLLRSAALASSMRLPTLARAKAPDDFCSFRRPYLATN